MSIHTTGCSLATPATTWMNLVKMMLRQRTQTLKASYGLIALIRKVQNKQTYRDRKPRAEGGGQWMPICSGIDLFFYNFKNRGIDHYWGLPALKLSELKAVRVIVKSSCWCLMRVWCARWSGWECRQCLRVGELMPSGNTDGGDSTVKSHLAGTPSS